MSRRQSRAALQGMLDQLDVLERAVQPYAANRVATVRAARRLNRGSAMLATSVLLDSALEHYRGSFANRAMVTPLVVHTTPEIAMVGVTPEEAAKDNEGNVNGRFPLAANGRALTLGSDTGVTQLVAADDGTLLGATLVGPRAGDLAGQLALALEMGATLTDLSEILYAHPGLGETVLEAAEHALGKAIHIANKG